MIKPKKPTSPEPLPSIASEIKLVPKWHVINTNRQTNINNPSSATKNKSSPCNVKTVLNDNVSSRRLPSAPIQTLRPTSEPRKATLMTEDGPIDVTIRITQEYRYIHYIRSYKILLLFI